jgi:hypothetical protein
MRLPGPLRSGSLESETVEYGHESRETLTLECLLWRGPGATVNDRPVLSSERERERPTSTNPLLSDSNKNLVLVPRWVFDTKTDHRLTVGRNINFDFDFELRVSVENVRTYLESWVRFETVASR